MPTLSYLVTVHNEDRTLRNLLEQVIKFIEEGDEVVILDDFSDNPETQKILGEFSKKDNVRLFQHALEKNYGAHKNYGAEQCKGEWIFQLDGDELPPETLLINIKSVIEANPDIELFLVPRINDFKGVTVEHAKRWGWRLSPCSACDNRPIVQWPDYQGRIYKNEPSRIKFTRRLHEQIEGYKKFANVPAEFDLALYHDKTIEVQEKTNIRYNTWFTEEENKGHAGFKNQ